MAELILTDLDEIVFNHLGERARRHGRTRAEEAKVILADALCDQDLKLWEPVDAIFQRLATSGRTFSDSAELLREDRDR
jgi:plasmid stability protein